MTTLVEDLNRQIARLEKLDPNGKLLKDLRTQLAAYGEGSDRSAEETYFSGRPLESRKPQASADEPMRPPRSGGTLQGDTDGEVQSSTTESKPSALVQREGESTSANTKSSFAEALDAALEKAKQQNKGKSLEQLEIEREQRQHSETK